MVRSSSVANGVQLSDRCHVGTPVTSQMERQVSCATPLLLRPNLNGQSDPLTATSTAYDLIYSLDGYHPVSLVLYASFFLND